MGQVQALKITTLVENLVQAGGLGQWGLSFLLELIDAKGEKRKVVFDTGSNKEAFLHNVKFLKVDLRDVDCVVISKSMGTPTLSFRGFTKIRKESGDGVGLRKEKALKRSKRLEVR